MTSRDPIRRARALWGRWLRPLPPRATASPEIVLPAPAWIGPRPLPEIRRFVTRVELEGEFFRDLM